MTKKELAEIILDGVNCDAAECKDCKIYKIAAERKLRGGCDSVTCVIAGELAELILKEEDLVAQNQA